MDLHITTIRKNNFEEVRVALSKFKDHQLLDLRVYTDKQGETEKVPTKKGISVNVTMIPDLLKALTEAHTQAKEHGLL